MPTLERNHLSDAYAVWLSAGWNDTYALDEPDFIKSWSNSRVKVGAWKNGRLVGIGRANTDGVMYSMIHDVVVDTPFRCQGHGKAIITELLGVLSSMGIRSIQLMSARGQSPFYSRFGFKSRDEERPGMDYDWTVAKRGAASDAFGTGEV